MQIAYVWPVIASSRGSANGTCSRPFFLAEVHRDVAHRPGAVERDERDQVLELRRLDGAQRLAHSRRLELEHPGRVAAREHRVRPRSSSGSAPMSTPPTRSTALSITSRLRSPRKSILRRPRSTTSFIPTCVTTSCSDPFCWSGTTSMSGCAPMTTPAAWIESARVRPSSGRARSMISFATGSESTAWRSSAPAFSAASSVWPGPSGTSFAMRSTTP